MDAGLDHGSGGHGTAAGTGPHTGLATEREEAAPGGACAAAPLFVGRRPVAALSVALPVARFAPERLGAAVLTASFGLAHALTRGKRWAAAVQEMLAR